MAVRLRRHRSSRHDVVAGADNCRWRAEEGHCWLGFVVCDLGFGVCGLWFVVCGLWFVVCGLWFAVEIGAVGAVVISRGCR